MKRLSIILGLGVFLVISVTTSAQKDNAFIYGEVLDLKKEHPVVFATLRIKGRALGVISNSDGGFRLPSRFRDEGEILVISSLGYKTLEIPISSLEVRSSNRILLEAEPIQLMESVVVGKRKRPSTARAIIKRAIDKIPMNYPQTPFSYVGYYRDYQKKEKKYYNLNEALIHVKDQGFSSNDNDSTQIRLYNYLENHDFNRNEISAKPYNYISGEKIIANAHLFNFGGNELGILRIHDAIRNYKVKTYSYVDVLEKGLIRNHSLERIADEIIDGERAFVIVLRKNKPGLSIDEFSEQPATSRFIAEGKIFISQSTYAIHKFSYKVLDTQVEKGRKDSSKNENLVFEVIVEYKDHKGKMYPNYISFQNVFTLKKSALKVVGITLDKTDQSLGVSFNRPTTRLVDRTEKNFDLRLNGKKIRISQVVYRDMGYQLYFKPEDFAELTEVIEGMNTIDQIYVPGVFEMYFANIIDDQGNDINSYKLEDYRQFREFFTQQVVEMPQERYSEENYINKNIPLSANKTSKEQIDFEKFWMNTPLIINE